MDQFLPDFQQRFMLRVALLRGADGALIEAAQLQVTPRWFASQSSSPELVRRAFRDFATTFRTSY